MFNHLTKTQTRLCCRRPLKSVHPEQEVNIWCDEKEIQNEKRQALNDALGNLTSGRFSPILSTLNASWDDISSTQQKYYFRKAREVVAATLSVISPGQERDHWKCIQNDSDLIERDESSSSKRKHFVTNIGLIDVLIKAYDQVESWQTKRQILSLFAFMTLAARTADVNPGFD